MNLKNIQNSKLINNLTKGRLELLIQDKIIFLEYIIVKEKLIIVNTHFPSSLKKIKDLGLILIKKVNYFALKQNLTVSATCPYFNGLINNNMD